MGQLSNEKLDAVANHLESCAACECALGKMDDLSDPLIASFRTSAVKHWAIENLPKGSLGAEFAPPFIDETVFSSRFDVTSLSEDAQADVGAIIEEALAIPVHDQLPDRLGPYEILEFIGHGGMGSVYRAHHTYLDKEVAIKVLPEGSSTSAELVARFQREVKVASRLSHPNLVTATDAGTEHGFHYFAMEYVEGTDASQFVANHSALPVAEACEIARQTAVGLQSLHESGLIHRDVKPSNIRVTVDGVVKVLDLGLSRHLPGFAEVGDATAANHVMGTHNYMSPEQIQSQQDIDQRSDIYSLGCTLYYLLTGRTPFVRDPKSNVVATLVAHCMQDIEPIRNLRQEIPEELERLIARMLARPRDERFASADEVAAALAPFASGANLDALPQCSSVGDEACQVTRNLLADPEVETRPNTSRRPVASRTKPKRRRVVLAWTLGTCVVCASAFVLASLFLSEPQETRVEQLAMGQIHSLMRVKPVISWADGPAVGDEVIFDQNNELVTVVSNGQRLFRLGTASHVTFEWDVQISQGPWDGNAGVYFGLRHLGNEIVYNRLVVRKIDPSKNASNHQLLWERVTAPQIGGAESSVTLAVAPISSPVRTTPMKVWLGEGGLGAVMFDGRQVIWRELAPMRSYTRAELTNVWGEFGLWCHKPGTTFQAAIVERFNAHDIP